MPARWMRQLVMCALALLLAAAGVGFAAVAAYLALAIVIAPSLAALATAGGAFVLAGIALLLGRRPAARGAEAPFDRERFIAEYGAVLGEHAASFFTAHPRGTALGSLLAGFVFGANPKLRTVFRDMLGL